MAILFCEICQHKVIPDNKGQCPQCEKQLEEVTPSPTKTVDPTESEKEVTDKKVLT